MSTVAKILDGVRQVLVMGEKIDQLGRNTERMADILRNHETRISRLEGASMKRQGKLPTPKGDQ